MTTKEINEVQRMINSLSMVELGNFKDATHCIDSAIEAFKYGRTEDGVKSTQSFYKVLHGSWKFNDQIRERLS